VCSVGALAELPTPQEKIENKDLQQNGEMKKYMQVSTTVLYVFLLTTLSINIIKVFHIIHNPLLDLVLVLDLFLPFLFLLFICREMHSNKKRLPFSNYIQLHVK
jgi:hypothetical protein